jgi:ABC-2 type transport system permease protein
MTGINKTAVKALAGRELKSYFLTPSAYVVLLVFYVLSGYLFVSPLFLIGQASIKSLADFIPLLSIFLVPALTMGQLSEELKSGTFETLATLPLEDSDIVVGKFLGFSGLFSIAIGGLLYFAVALSFLAAPPASLDWGETLGILCGFLLQGLMLGSIGLFCSSLAKNQIVAFVTAFLLGFFFFMIGKLSQLFGGFSANISDYLGFDSHLINLSKGVLDSRDLLYFASFIFIFLYFTVQRLKARRL